MNISYNWLAQYVDIPYSPDELAERLTMVGIEVENIEKAHNIPEGIIVAEILEREKHPDADKLSVCKVNTGTETVQIVCGAPNCDAGKKVPLATIGTKFNFDGKEMKIKKGKLRGVESHGMLCSSSELGLTGDASGLLELDSEAPIGKSLEEIVKSDTVYELEITSNRPDWLSYLGVARDIRALTGNELKARNSVNVTQGNDSNLITVLNSDSCPRYSALTMKNVKVQESPEWLQEALLSIGLRPINNIVDISNYILFETGQPLHIFDQDKLAEGRIIVRNATKGEKIVTLDEVERELLETDLVIADAEKAVCIAGVMGGENSGVSETTTNILIECAHFNSSSVRATSKRLGLSSDSSHRFERGVDVRKTQEVTERTVALIQEVAGGDVVSNFIDVKDESKFPEIKCVKCDFNSIRSLLGLEISNEDMIAILERLECKVEEKAKDIYCIMPPSFRLDLIREADVAEEIVRIHGLDKIPVIPVVAKECNSMRQDSYAHLAGIREELLALGLNECINYTLADKNSALKNKNISEDDLISVSNPISSDYSILRPTLFDGLFKNVERNISHNNHKIEMFEIGKIYSANKKQPEERVECSIILSGKKNPERFSDEKKVDYDFYDLKGIIESWFNVLNLTNISFKKGSHSIFKAGYCAEIIYRGRTLGFIGEVGKQYTSSMRLKSPMFAAIIELSPILQTKKVLPQYKPVPQFPATSRDITILASESLENSAVVNCIGKSRTAILEHIDLVDIYRGKELGENMKSMTYSLLYRDVNRTLKDKEVNKAHDSIRAKLEKDLGITLK